jgi:hypothetical protein
MGALAGSVLDALVIEEDAMALVTRLREHELTYIDKLR